MEAKTVTPRLQVISSLPAEQQVEHNMSPDVQTRNASNMQTSEHDNRELTGKKLYSELFDLKLGDHTLF